MILENQRSILQNYRGSQKLSQIGKFRLFKGIFQYSNFRNKFVIVFYSCVRVVKTNFLPQRFLGSKDNVLKAVQACLDTIKVNTTDPYKKEYQKYIHHIPLSFGILFIRLSSKYAILIVSL